MTVRICAVLPSIVILTSLENDYSIKVLSDRCQAGSVGCHKDFLKTFVFETLSNLPLNPSQNLKIGVKTRP